MSLPVTPINTEVVPREFLDRILSMAVEAGASDIHIRAGSQPLARLHGGLQALALPWISPQLAQDLVEVALPDSAAVTEIALGKDADFALTIPGIGRFRVNAFRSMGEYAMVLRHVSEVIPTPRELALPQAVIDMAGSKRGLVLVCGPTGSGKSTTLASLVGEINHTRNAHVLTIEDPVEFLHVSDQAVVSQREINTDVSSFAGALRSGMRQDPDVILLGEIRDNETMAIALQAAETGHLVLASLHAKSAVDAVLRALDLFPPDQQRLARTVLSEVLVGVVFQALIPAIDGNKRALVTEVMVGNSRVREAIAIPEKTSSLPEVLAESDFYGMHTTIQDLVRLVGLGQISVSEAAKNSPAEADFHVALKRSGYRGSHV